MKACSTLLRKLDVMQNMGLRIISGDMPTTPTNSMEIEDFIPPLSLRRLPTDAERFCLKELSCNNGIVLNHVLYPAEVTQPARTQHLNIDINILISGALPEITTIMGYVTNLARDMYISNM